MLYEKVRNVNRIAEICQKYTSSCRSVKRIHLHLVDPSRITAAPLPKEQLADPVSPLDVRRHVFQLLEIRVIVKPV